MWSWRVCARTTHRALGRCSALRHGTLDLERGTRGFHPDTAVVDPEVLLLDLDSVRKNEVVLTV